jgi:hypothetical protein
MSSPKVIKGLTVAAILCVSAAAHAGRVHVDFGIGVPLGPIYSQPGYAVPYLPPAPMYGPPVYGYAPPVVVVPVVPPTYVEREDVPEHAWYYCAPAKKYYPEVRACPSGWQTLPVRPAS